VDCDHSFSRLVHCFILQSAQRRGVLKLFSLFIKKYFHISKLVCIFTVQNKNDMKIFKVYTKENNQTVNIGAKGLTSAEGQVINSINDLGLTEAEITCPNGSLSIIRKDGSHHWNHPGFSFSFVRAEDVKKYRQIQNSKNV